MKEKSFWSKIKNIPLVELFLRLEGNPKVLILMEPLWGIPRTLILPFTTVYMYALGVSKVQIGWALSFTMALRVIFAALAGIITDKLGRKRTTMLCDFVAWVLPCLIWANAQTFWHFLVAMSFNSFDLGPVCWNCLWVEHSDPRDAIGISNWMTIGGLVSVFFSPLSGVLVKHFSLVPVVRVLYWVFAGLMIVKIICGGLFTQETEIGKQRMKETKGRSVFQMLGEYRHVFPLIFKNPGTMRTLAMMIIMYASTMISENFVSLFATETLFIPENLLAYLPILRALVMMAFLFGIQHVLEYFSFKSTMVGGFVVYIMAQSFLLLSPRLLRLTPNGQFWTLIVYTLLEAIAFAILNPRKESMMVHYIDDATRASSNALLNSLMLLCTIPFGTMAGNLSQINGAYPFLLNIGLFVAGLLMILLRQGELERPEAA